MASNFISSKDPNETPNMQLKRYNKEIMIGDETNELFDSLLQNINKC